MSIGSRLAEARKARGLTQEALAQRASLSTFTISKHERGVFDAMDSETLMRLASALSVAPAWLLHGEGDGPVEAAS